MSALDRSAPKFCLNPRSMASRRESCMTPGTGFAGTLLENGLTPSVSGIACPGEEGVSVCPKDVAAPQNSIAASSKARCSPQVKGSLTEESLLTPKRDGRETHANPGDDLGTTGMGHGSVWMH